VEPAQLASLNFETQCMSAKRAALVTALRTERLEYEGLGIVTARGHSTPSNFVRSFKARSGMTPTQCHGSA